MSEQKIVEILEADLTWIRDRFESQIQVAVDEHGLIIEVGRLGHATTRRLERRALLPGMINAHSHAFQRGLRGRGETFPDDAGSFWTWRQEMYALVEQMDEHLLYTLSRQAFDEMLDAGITTVGEFHYLHHNASEQGFAFDEVVLKAAADAGIRIVLLNACYETGGIDAPLEGGQRRFNTFSAARYWEQMDRLSGMIDRRLQSLGVVAHSIRAVPPDRIAELHAESDRRRLPFHMHVEEQPREIEECVRRYHRPPMALLNEQAGVNPLFTAVHCTHTAAADMHAWLSAGGNVCICPLTEANLGDGLADVAGILREAGRICLGTDSNARISMVEEMRWLEYGQRLKLLERGICRDAEGSVARLLWRAATINGGHALGVQAGGITAGSCADFMTIDLDAPALKGSGERELLDAVVFGAGSEVVTEVCVGGRWLRGG